MIRKTVSLLAVCVMLSAPLFGGCMKQDDSTTIDKLMDCLQKREYPRIYQLLAQKPHDSISLVDFSARYEQIYSTIGLQKAACTVTDVQKKDDSHQTVHFIMEMTCAKLGVVDLDMDANLVLEDGQWRVDWTPELILPGMQEDDSAKLRVDNAARGEIFDANGEILAKNGFALSVYVDTAQVHNYETLIRELAPKLGMTEDSIRKRLAGAIRLATGATAEPDAEAGASASADATGTPQATPSPSPTATPTTAVSAGASPSATASTQPRQMNIVIKAYPKDGLTQAQMDELKAIQGVGLDTDYMTRIRIYPHGNTLAQVLGYTGVVSAEDLKKPENASVPVDSLIGKEGLEKAFEADLRGKAGYSLVIMDKDGKQKMTIASKPAVDGKDLRLTIDLELQQRAEVTLMRYLTKEMAGSVVITDPDTGYIQAIASAPAFNPNIFSYPVNEDEWKALNDPVNQRPLLNRATKGLYPPGSTFKPFTASMGLVDGKITPSFMFTGLIENNKWKPTDERWVYPPITRKESYSGPVNLGNAITYSDNIFFAYTAMQVGSDEFYQHCLDYGFTGQMKFDLPLSRSQIANAGRIDSLRTLADSGYGQGELLITPVQMAALFGSLANGGDVMLPRLVEKVCRTDGARYIADKTNPPEVWKQKIIPQSILNILQPSLKKVALLGSAKAMNTEKLRPYEICAKTGTAEIGNDKSREIAWLMAYNTAKKDKMNRLVCITLEVPAGEGSALRTNIAKELFADPVKAVETNPPPNEDNKPNN